MKAAVFPAIKASTLSEAQIGASYGMSLAAASICCLILSSIMDEDEERKKKVWNHHHWSDYVICHRVWNTFEYRKSSHLEPSVDDTGR